MTDWLLESADRLEQFQKDQLFIDSGAIFVIQEWVLHIA